MKETEKCTQDLAILIYILYTYIYILYIYCVCVYIYTNYHTVYDGLCKILDSFANVR